MRLDITHGVTEELAGILSALITNQEKIMADLSGITGAVESLTSVVDSAVALLDNLAEEIRNTEPNQEALDELANSIDAQRQELADAVAANTEGGAQPEVNPNA